MTFQLSSLNIRFVGLIFSNEELDLLSILRNGEDVTAIIQKAIQSKHAKNAGIDFENQNYKNRSMTAIGG